jgi:fluoride exporter
MASPSATQQPDPSHALPPFDARIAAAVVVGGAVGTFLRAELSVAWVQAPDQWPWPTFMVNLLGAALLGAIAVRTARRPRLHGLLGTGLCGGLTTFSTMQLELLRMLDAGAMGLALAYLSASVVLGLVVATVAARLAMRATAT